MDLDTLSSPPPPLTREVAKEWLRSFRRSFPSMCQPSDAWASAMESCAPKGLVGTQRLSQSFVDWIDENKLREPSSAGDVLSLKGVSVMLSPDHPRLPPDRAWEQAALLMAVVDWVNSAPAKLAPMRVADVLLFGSMTSPSAAHHGDLDAFVLLESKKPGANQECQNFLVAHGLYDILQPNGLSFESFRMGLLDWVKTLQPFVSVDDQPRTLSVLLDADPSLACHSLMRKTWDLGSLSQTTADEQSDVVLRCLDNAQARPAARVHIARSMAAAKARLKMEDPAISSSRALALGLSKDAPRKSIWWASLNTPPPMSSLASVDPQAAGRWERLRAPAQQHWRSSDPIAQSIERRWGEALMESPSPKPSGSQPRP